MKVYNFWEEFVPLEGISLEISFVSFSEGKKKVNFRHSSDLDEGGG